MNVEIGAEAALFPEKEYINGIAVAVHTLIEALQRYNCQADLIWPDRTVPLGHLSTYYRVTPSILA